MKSYFNISSQIILQKYFYIKPQDVNNQKSVVLLIVFLPIHAETSQNQFKVHFRGFATCQTPS